MGEVRRCTRCVMDDSSDKTITFDLKGHCRYCNTVLAIKDKVYLPNELGAKKIEQMVSEIKSAGRKKKYDCILGLSGGLDSSYLLYQAYKWGLRPLVIHIDDGYDTKITKKNLKRLISATGFDCRVVKPDAKQYDALTLAFMRAGVANIAIPQDNILLAFLYAKMKEHKINYLLNGLNFATESILQEGNTHRNTDLVHIRDIEHKFDMKKTDKLRFISTTGVLIDRYLLKVHTVTLLNYLDYNRDRALRELNEFCGFEYYGRKHLENLFTAFVQLYWFPRKFGVDKRTSHLSSMIVSGQLTRDEALKELEEPLCDEAQMEEYIEIITKRLGITRQELDNIVNAPSHQHEDYRVEDTMLNYRFIKFVKDRRMKRRIGS